MKKLLLSIFIIVICFNSFGQAIIQRSGVGNTVQDARLSAQYNLFVPKYADTTAALAGNSEGIDSCGAIIFTYDVMSLWYRSCYGGKSWVQIMPSGSPLGAFPWKVGGNNMFAGSSGNQIFGITSSVASNYGIDVRTRNITRLIIDSTGINRSSGAANKFLTFDTTTKVMYYTDGGSAAAGWELTGNSGTTAGTNFLGTTDDVNLMFKVNNIQSGLINKNSRNTSFGYQSLLANTTGTDNIAIGGNALIANEDGIENIGIGVYSLSSNESGGGNVAMGFTSLSANIVGSNNTAIGTNTLSASTGSANTAVGSTSLAGTTGSSNTGIGSSSLGSLTSGSSNIAIGSNASGYLTNESFRLAINSINRTNLLGDTTQSIIYGAQDATAANQRLYLNSQVYLPYTTAAANAADSMMVILPSTGKVGYRAIPTSSGGTVTGSGTTNYLPKWSSSTALGNSSITDDGSTVTIGVAAVGTTSHRVPLLIGGTSTTSTLTLQSTSGSGTTGSDIIFKDDNTEWMRILNSGNVGIGMTAPAKKFAVEHGNGRFTFDDNSNAPQILLDRIASSGPVRLDFAFGGSVKGGFNLNSSGEMQFFASSGGYYPTFYSNGSERMRIDGSGNVGIGTTSPTAAKLQVTGNGAASVSGGLWDGTWFSGGTSTTTKPQLLIEPTGTTSTAWSTSGTGIGVNAASGFTGNLIDMQVNSTTRMVLTGGGELQLGSAFTGLAKAGAYYGYNAGSNKSYYGGEGAVAIASTGHFGISSSATTPFSQDVYLNRQSAGVFGVGTSTTNALGTLNLATLTASTKINVTTGSNKSAGVSGAMTAGTITISTTAVTASSLIFLTPVGAGTGQISLGTVTAGTSFVINSSDILDVRQVQYWLIN